MIFNYSDSFVIFSEETLVGDKEESVIKGKDRERKRRQGLKRKREKGAKGIFSGMREEKEDVYNEIAKRQIGQLIEDLSEIVN